MKILIILFLSTLPVIASAQGKWQLKKDRDGIQVYTRSVEGSDIREIRVICTLQATPSQLTALLLDAKAHEQWVYNTSQSYLIKQISPHQQIYYSEIVLPWPMANRDVVAHMKIEQNPKNRVMLVNIQNAEHAAALKKGNVLVPASKVKWIITPVGENLLGVEYFGQADPGGNVPSWVVNAFSTKGPYETFKRLKQLVTSPVYAHASYDFIQD